MSISKEVIDDVDGLLVKESLIKCFPAYRYAVAIAIVLGLQEKSRGWFQSLALIPFLLLLRYFVCAYMEGNQQTEPVAADHRTAERMNRGGYVEDNKPRKVPASPPSVEYAPPPYCPTVTLWTYRLWS